MDKLKYNLNVFYLRTKGTLKSHSRSGNWKGATNAPLAPSTWIPISHPFLAFTFSSASLSFCMGKKETKEKRKKKKEKKS
jgi:hypothetical protein